MLCFESSWVRRGTCGELEYLSYILTTVLIISVMAQYYDQVPLSSNGIRDTGIDAIAVGAGFGDIACSIECKGKGHRVMILEKVHKLRDLGQ